MIFDGPDFTQPPHTAHPHSLIYRAFNSSYFEKRGRSLSANRESDKLIFKDGYVELPPYSSIDMERVDQFVMDVRESYMAHIPKATEREHHLLFYANDRNLLPRLVTVD